MDLKNTNEGLLSIASDNCSAMALRKSKTLKIKPNPKPLKKPWFPQISMIFLKMNKFLNLKNKSTFVISSCC